MLEKINECIPSNTLWYLGIQSLPSEEQACVLFAKMNRCIAENDIALLAFRYLQLKEAEVTAHAMAAFSGVLFSAFLTVCFSEINFLLDNISALIILLLLDFVCVSVFLPSFANYRLYSRGVEVAENQLQLTLKSDDLSKLKDIPYAVSSFPSVKELLEKHSLWSEPSTALLPKRFREVINSKKIQ